VIKRFLLKSGFTLIEFIILIAIIAILSVHALIKSTGMSVRLRTQGLGLASDLRYTQTLSMTHGQRYCLVFGTQNYQVVNSATSLPETLGAGSTVALGAGISYGSFSPVLTMIIFDSHGAPYYSTSATCNAANAAAATSISSAASIGLIRGTQSIAILITPETGWITQQ